MHNLKIKLVVDVEEEFYYKVPSPHFSNLGMIKWHLNKIAGRIYKYPRPTKKGFMNLIECFKKYNVPAAFCVTGQLYVGNLKDIIEKEKDNPLFKWGLHGWFHEALTLAPQEVVDSVFKAGVKAASTLGITPEVFEAPFDMVEDINDPNKVYDILNKYHIKDLIYSGVDDGLKIKRYYDVKPMEYIHFINRYWISENIEGTSSKEHVDKIISDLSDFKDKEAVYVITMHDFTWVGTKNLDRVMEFIKKEGFECI